MKHQRSRYFSLLFGATCLAFSWRTQAQSAEVNAPPPSSPVLLTVEPQTPEQWVMTLANHGDTSVRVLADARLLRMEVIGNPLPDALARASKDTRAPKLYVRGKMPVCEMPAGMRPRLPSPERWLELGPGERYRESFHPVAFCGASKTARELGPGAVIYPYFGWPNRSNTKKNVRPTRAVSEPPYAIEPLRGQLGPEPQRGIEGTPALVPAVTDPATAPASATSTDALANQPPASEMGPRLVLTGPAQRDVASGHEATVTMTVRNTGKRSALVHLRSDDITFSLRSSGDVGAAAVSCGVSLRHGAVRDFFSTFGAGKSKPITMSLLEICPSSSLARPGVYELVARLRLEQTGEIYGLHAFTTDVTATSPTWLRVRSGTLPYHATPPQAEAESEGRAPDAEQPAL